MSTYDRNLWVYNCRDCVITMEVQEVLESNIHKMGLDSPASFQQSLFNVVLRMMIRGVRIDIENRGKFAGELLEELSKREAYFYRVLGHKLNPQSPKQMKNLFYGDFGQPAIKTYEGKEALNDEALQSLSVKEPLLAPLIQRIQEYRSLKVFFSTFVNAPLDIDGRMRCSFNIAGTDTDRFSSSKNAFGSGTNLQNVPKGGEEADGLELPNVRKLFIPDQGHTFFDIDLSSADLRIVTWEADEQEMKAMLREGVSPYIVIAREFYHDNSIQKTLPNGKDHPKYKIFKSFAHGTHYLGSARGLAKRLGLTVHDAEKTQAWYFGRFPKIKDYQERIKDEIIKRRYVENIFGYRYYVFGRIDDDAFRAAAAWKPQSTVACIINRGLVNIDNNFKEAQVLLQVHDSLAGQYPTYLGEYAEKRIIEECSIELPYAEPLTIPVGIKTSTKSWGDCE